MLITFLNKPELFLHTVKWFQVLLYNSHNLTLVIFLQTVRSIWPIDKTQSGATTPGQSGPGSNDNEGVLNIPQISKARVLWSDGLMLYPRHLLGEWGILPFCRDAVGVFYSPSWLGCLLDEILKLICWH